MNEKNISALDRSKCTACGACAQKCPVGCISMSEGQYEKQPVVDSIKCVSCGMCVRVCPIDKETKISYEQKAYALVNHDHDQLMQEASGGAFGIFATYVLEHGGVVYGCAFTNLKAQHIRVDNIKKLPKLFGSKYLQSDTLNTYSQVMNDLKNGMLVLYSGTPCQIAGLLGFLDNKPYEKLITIDIICHGVPSQAYFDKFIQGLENDKKIDIASFSFRDKENKKWGLSGTYKGTYKGTGKNFSKNLFYFDHYYYYYFLRGFTYRKSCYQCKYANLNRVSDITIGDLWGEEQFRFNFDTKNGCSLAIVNTAKGHNLISEVSCHKEEVDLNIAAKYNMQLNHPSKKPDNYDDFERQFNELTYKEIQRHFLKTYRLDIIKSKISYCFPPILKRFIKRIIK